MFFRRILPAGALGLWLALGQAQAQPGPSFVDAHAHLNDVDLQLAMMDRHGVAQAVVFWGGRSDNEAVAEAARRHPGRFIPFVSISPERTAYRAAWERPDGPEAAALLRRLDDWLASGLFRGIGEINAVHFPAAGFGETDFSPDGPMMDAIMALARRHRVPVMLHVESTRMAELSRLLERHAQVPVIWAHGGYTPLYLARRMLERHPNLHYELSARTWPRHPRSPEYSIVGDGQRVWPQWLALIESMPGRFLVGTDASQRFTDTEAMKFQSVQDMLAQLSPEAREQVARGTVLRLVGAPR